MKKKFSVVEKALGLGASLTAVIPVFAGFPVGLMIVVLVYSLIALAYCAIPWRQPETTRIELSSIVRTWHLFIRSVLVIGVSGGMVCGFAWAQLPKQASETVLERIPRIIQGSSTKSWKMAPIEELKSNLALVGAYDSEKKQASFVGVSEALKALLEWAIDGFSYLSSLCIFLLLISLFFIFTIQVIVSGVPPVSG